jgi:hypothetical protein
MTAAGGMNAHKTAAGTYPAAIVLRDLRQRYGAACVLTAAMIVSLRSDGAHQG